MVCEKGFGYFSWGFGYFFTCFGYFFDGYGYFSESYGYFSNGFGYLDIYWKIPNKKSRVDSTFFKGCVKRGC
ncbi:hypothetical protein BAVI_06949 [Neobacillus vireti LMG 21834]|uniref:Uncharacterized protein n=1 Tax=Neobacillus vireti LMG 21834 TaxID=1131730 RepID=A0AB94IR42_9BACI|nr:hypothetical protein BAVI_06949 [Neobacillus vireti LMG 21834]KLT16629.1 hypothetical protein AA980_16460 [Neobacillus vireti]